MYFYVYNISQSLVNRMCPWPWINGHLVCTTTSPDAKSYEIKTCVFVIYLLVQAEISQSMLLPKFVNFFPVVLFIFVITISCRVKFPSWRPLQQASYSTPWLQSTSKILNILNHPFCGWLGPIQEHVPRMPLRVRAIHHLCMSIQHQNIKGIQRCDTKVRVAYGLY